MGPPHRALVIEDSLEIRQLITRVLERESFVVDTAPDGEEGIRRLREILYDFIIIDLMMPNAGGEVVLKHLTATDPAAERKVVITTAAAPRVVDGLVGRGRWRVLPKPFDLHELVAYAREAVTRKDR